MNKKISKFTKYFLYSILVVIISNFIFYVPIFYNINIDNFKEIIHLERTDVIALIVFFALLLLCEKKKRIPINSIRYFIFVFIFYPLYHL